MRILNFIAFALLIISLSSCCSNKGVCSITSFKNVKMIGFTTDDFTQSVVLTQYDGQSGFTQVIQTATLNASVTDDPNIFMISTIELNTSSNYEITVVKTAKKYRISNFSFDKVACGKCFMRSNNNFGYRLNGYAVNGRAQAYEGTVVINK